MIANEDIRTVLFFNAAWCPSCRSTDGEINQNLSKIPSDLLILGVDYDSAKDLKVKYGVTSQHTFVLVDAQ
jgi:thiol-disulfide isomerase/thioredoxin